MVAKVSPHGLNQRRLLAGEPLQLALDRQPMMSQRPWGALLSLPGEDPRRRRPVAARSRTLRGLLRCAEGEGLR